MKEIPAGCQVMITSWENDADCYNTKVLSGLTEDTARFCVEFSQLFKKSYHEPGGLAANASNTEDVKWDELFKAFKEIYAKYPGALSEIFHDPNFSLPDGDDEYHDLICEVACTFFGGSEFNMFRVFDSYEAYYFPTKVSPIEF